MKTAYLVTGPESSGNRMLLSILLQAGCVDHTKQAEPDWKNLIPNTNGPIALMRSMPHAKDWYSLGGLTDLLKSFGYSVKIIIPVRDWTSVCKSQVAIQYASDEVTAKAKIDRAYKHLFNAITANSLDYLLVSYESFVLNTQAATGSLLNWCGLSFPASLPVIYNGNTKHWEQPDKLPQATITKTLEERQAIYAKIHNVRWKQSLRVLTGAIPYVDSILDLGGRSDFTSMVEDYYGKTAVTYSKDLRKPLDIPDQSYGLVMCTEVIEHIAESGDEHVATFGPLRRLLSEIKRVLKPGKWFYLSTPNAAGWLSLKRWLDGNSPMSYDKHLREYTADEINELLNSQGLPVRRCVILEDMLGPTEIQSLRIKLGNYSSSKKRGGRLHFISTGGD